MPEDLIARIDSERGDVGRSRYMLRLLERGLKEVAKKK